MSLLAIGAAAQDPPDITGPVRDEVEGMTIRAIRFEGATSTERITRMLQTKVGNPLRRVDVEDDERRLWSVLKIIARGVFTEKTQDGGVIVTFEVEEPKSYDRTVFRGLDHFSDEQVRAILGITPARRVTDILALDHAADLEDRYRRDGFYFARVTLQRDEEAGILTMLVDEGPKVTVGAVDFRGNRAFPGSAPLNLYRNLVGSAELESKPGWALSPGSPYSDDAVEADREKLRIYYRGLGYRDALVELAERSFSEDLSRVDITFRVVEGRRYRIRSVDLEHYTATGELDTDPLYPKELLLEDIIGKPGEYYDRDLINRDKAKIESFYGERGHPMSGAYGRAQIPDALRWLGDNWAQPVERFDPDTAEIDLIYQLVEGTPKTLRDVVLRGNTDTQDRIVRRKVLIYPGEILNITKVDRSLQLLDSLRYFQDPESLAGVTFELLPVEGVPTEVDLAIEVQEGDTGSFLWGAGVSTGLGVQGRIQFNKRNFDLFRGPSSASPGTVIEEIVESKAFHGAGQELQLLLAPGTQISTFQISFEEPDLFGDHVDTIGLRVQGFRRLRLFDSYQTDSTGAILTLSRNISENVTVGMFLRQETVEVSDLDPNAPTIVFDAEGQTELRSLTAQLRMRDIDNFIAPTQGYDLQLYGELGGGPLGAEEDFYKLGLTASYYHRLHLDSLDRAHVLYVNQRFDVGGAYGTTDDLFLTERWYLGGSNLRGFDERRAGPTQFTQPLGGEVRYVSRLEYQFPLVSTRVGNSQREVELLRGVLFSDAGLLGTAIDDPTFGDLRLSIGAGVRIRVPYLGLPIALDFGLPLVYQQTDDRRPFYFSLSR